MYHQDNNSSASKTSVTEFCRATCRRILDQLQRIKNSIQTEFSAQRRIDAHLVRLALNEAEAEAWQTGFPQLVFPVLAQEKASAVANWSSRQEQIRHSGPSLAFAA